MILNMANSVTWLQTNWACVSFTEDITESRKTHKHAANTHGCNRRLAKYVKEGKHLIMSARSRPPTAEDLHPNNPYFYNHVSLSNFIWVCEHAVTSQSLYFRSIVVANYENWNVTVRLSKHSWTQLYMVSSPTFSAISWLKSTYQAPPLCPHLQDAPSNVWTCDHSAPPYSVP